LVLEVLAELRLAAQEAMAVTPRLIHHRFAQPREAMDQQEATAEETFFRQPVKVVTEAGWAVAWLAIKL
jgi:hypothetical protein